ncbi:MAG: Tfp pilus assembly protein FimT/FimU [Deltaproteobacteria bacterium]
MAQIKSQIPPTILSQNKSSLVDPASKSARNDGFTLIEILLVLSIIVLVLSFGMPVVSRITGQNINTSARKLTSLVRGVRTDAILLNSIYRLSLDLDKNTYLVESQKLGELLNESSTLSKKRDPKNPEATETSDGFAPVEKYFKEPKPLPAGVVFNGILKEKEGKVTEGIAYIYFFPNGLNEKAMVYLNSQSAKEGGYSLLVHPTAGKVEFFKKRVDQF